MKDETLFKKIIVECMMISKKLHDLEKDIKEIKDNLNIKDDNPKK